MNASALNGILQAYYPDKGLDKDPLPARVQLAWQAAHKLLRIAGRNPDEDDFRDAYNYLQGAYELYLQEFHPGVWKGDAPSEDEWGDGPVRYLTRLQDATEYPFGWGGPGWYFFNEKGAAHGPYADKGDAEMSMAQYALTPAGQRGDLFDGTKSNRVDPNAQANPLMDLDRVRDHAKEFAAAHIPPGLPDNIFPLNTDREERQLILWLATCNKGDKFKVDIGRRIFSLRDHVNNVMHRYVVLSPIPDNHLVCTVTAEKILKDSPAGLAEDRSKEDEVCLTTPDKSSTPATATVSPSENIGPNSSQITSEPSKRAAGETSSPTSKSADESPLPSRSDDPPPFGGPPKPDTSTLQSE
jgi:hypothetical protein